MYLAWLGACWQGRVSAVIAELRVWQGRVGEPPPGEELKEHDPRRLVAEEARRPAKTSPPSAVGKN